MSFVPSTHSASNHLLAGLGSYSYAYTVTAPLTKRNCTGGATSLLYQAKQTNTTSGNTTTTSGNWVGNGGIMLYRTLVSNGYFAASSGFTYIKDAVTQTSLLYNPTSQLFIP